MWVMRVFPPFSLFFSFLYSMLIIRKIIGTAFRQVRLQEVGGGILIQIKGRKKALRSE